MAPSSTRSSRLENLIRANTALATVESLDELMPALLDLAESVTGAEASSLLLWNQASELLEFRLARNAALGEDATRQLTANVSLGLGEGLAGWVARERKPLLIEDVAADDRFSSTADEMTGFTTRSLICVPVVHGDDLLGVIQVLNPSERAGFDAEDLQLLESFADLASVALVRSRLLDYKIEQERIQVQLEAASRIQRMFLPKPPELGDGCEFWAVTRPAVFVGGDLYDCLPLHDGSRFAYVADVSGKGLPASLVMAALWSRVRSHATQTPRPDTLLEAVNSSLQDFLCRDAMFVTMAACRFWPSSGKAQFSCAGHLPPIIAGEGPPQEVGGLLGFPIGVSPNAEYGLRETVLLPGRSVLLMTDGVTEAMSPKRELYGSERVMELVAASPTPPFGERLARDVESWRAGKPPNDDTTILEIFRRRE